MEERHVGRVGRGRRKMNLVIQREDKGEWLMLFSGEMSWQADRKRLEKTSEKELSMGSVVQKEAGRWKVWAQVSK